MLVADLMPADRQLVGIRVELRTLARLRLARTLGAVPKEETRDAGRTTPLGQKVHVPVETAISASSSWSVGWKPFSTSWKRSGARCAANPTLPAAGGRPHLKETRWCHGLARIRRPANAPSRLRDLTNP